MAAIIHFEDKSVPYEVFVEDVSRRIVKMLKESRELPEFICQNKAFKMFGKSNVLRWRKMGYIEPKIRPGKIEYGVYELQQLYSRTQDYFQ